LQQGLKYFHTEASANPFPLPVPGIWEVSGRVGLYAAAGWLAVTYVLVDIWVISAAVETVYVSTTADYIER
jgi:hypothetical protein